MTDDELITRITESALRAIRLIVVMVIVVSVCAAVVEIARCFSIAGLTIICATVIFVWLVHCGLKD